MSFRALIHLILGAALLIVVVVAGLWLGPSLPEAPRPPEESAAKKKSWELQPEVVVEPEIPSAPDVTEASAFAQDILVEPPTTPEDNPLEAARVKKRKVRVRAGPDVRYHVLAHAREGQVLKITTRLKGWCFVLLPTGLRGWIRCDLLDDSI